MAYSNQFGALIGCVVAASALLGCASTPIHQARANDSHTPPRVNPEAREILTRNALNCEPGVMAIGAGDRFGSAIYARYVAVVRAENGLLPVRTGVATVETIPE